MQPNTPTLYQNALNSLNTFIQAGGTIVIIILIISIIALAIVIERLFFYSRNSQNPTKLENQISPLIKNNQIQQAIQTCRQHHTSVSKVLATGLSYWHLTPYDMQPILEQEIRKETFRWFKNLSFLSLTVKVTPLLGLLGTVLGMVEVFHALPNSTQAPMITLAAGIWKALFTTVAGLTVAIPFLFIHGWLSSKCNNQEETLSRSADFLLRHRIEENYREK